MAGAGVATNTFIPKGFAGFEDKIIYKTDIEKAGRLCEAKEEVSKENCISEIALATNSDPLCTRLKDDDKKDAISKEEQEKVNTKAQEELKKYEGIIRENEDGKKLTFTLVTRNVPEEFSEIAEIIKGQRIKATGRFNIFCGRP